LQRQVDDLRFGAPNCQAGACIRRFPAAKIASMLRSLALLLLSLTSACAIARQDNNEPIDAQTIRAFEPGKTTAREIVEKLGAPTEVVQLGRRTAYRFDATTAKAAALILVVVNFANQDTRSDRLWVFFDENDVLTHYGASFGTHRTQYAMPWEDVHEASDNQVRDAARPGVGR
jgi:outer membrane protein assembly factor BamE (lipoprotein component of BamABCDE complex)